MTALQFTIITVLFQHHKPLLTPVLQHLANGVTRYVGTLYADAVLEGSLEAELHVQTLKDRVNLARASSLNFVAMYRHSVLVSE